MKTLTYFSLNKSVQTIRKYEYHLLRYMHPTIYSVVLNQIGNVFLLSMVLRNAFVEKSREKNPRKIFMTHRYG